MQAQDNVNDRFALQRSPVLAVWTGVAIATLVIAGESTATMSHARTGAWLHMLLGSSLGNGALNHVNSALRKCGHLTGYGLLGLVTFYAVTVTSQRWKSVERSSKRRLAACAGILFTTLVAVCDELHQRYLPGRTASLRDVALDTCGAILFLAVAEFIPWRRCFGTARDEVSSVLTAVPVGT